jgi:hypothetical protein
MADLRGDPPEAYDPEDVIRLFQFADEEERDVIEFFCGVAFRNGEGTKERTLSGMTSISATKKSRSIARSNDSANREGKSES